MLNRVTDVTKQIFYVNIIFMQEFQSSGCVSYLSCFNVLYIKGLIQRAHIMEKQFLNT